jgi:hypothetical protein
MDEDRKDPGVINKITGFQLLVTGNRKLETNNNNE